MQTKMTAKLCGFNQAMQVFLQQSMVFAREQREEARRRLKRRLNASDNTLNEDVKTAEQLEKICKKLQMRSVTLSCSTGLTELALVDRLTQALMWSVLSARHEGRVNFGQYRAQVQLFDLCSDLLFRCVEAFANGDTALAQLWAAADQILIQASTNETRATALRHKRLPTAPTWLHSSSTSGCWRTWERWLKMKWAHDTIEVLNSKEPATLSMSFTKEQSPHLACGNVVKEYHRAVQLMEQAQNPSSDTAVTGLREKAAIASLERVKCLEAEYRSEQMPTQTMERPSSDQFVNDRTVRVLIELADVLEARLNWCAQVTIHALPAAAQYRAPLETMVQVCKTKCYAIAEEYLSVESSSCYAVTELYSTVALPGPEVFRDAEHCADKRHQLRLATTEDDASLALAEGAWIAATSAYDKYFSSIIEVLTLEWEDTSRLEEIDLLAADAASALLQARNYAHRTGGMCQDAITYHSNAQKITQENGPDSEEARVWERASQKMLAAAGQCFDRIARIQADDEYPILREFPTVLECEWHAVHESELAELLHRCSLTTSAEEQAALDRVVMLSRQRILLEDAPDALKRRSGCWGPTYQGALDLTVRVLVTAHKAAAAVSRKRVTSPAGPVAQADSTAELDWTVSALTRYCELLGKVASADQASVRQWKAVTVMETLLTAINSLEQQRRVRTIFEAVDAHLQGLSQRGDLLLEAATYLDRPTNWSSQVADLLLEKALPVEEIHSRIGVSNAPLCVPDRCTTFLEQIAQACFARREALVARNAHTYEGSEQAATPLQQQLQTLYSNSWRFHNRHVEYLEKAIAQRASILAKDSKTVADLVRQAHWAQRTAESYLQAARALEQGLPLVSKYRKMAAESYARLAPKYKFLETNVLAEVAAHRCVRAAAALAAGTDADTIQYWRAAADAATAAIHDCADPMQNQAFVYLDTDCAKEIAEAQRKQKPRLMALWESLRAGMVVVREKDLLATVAEGNRRGSALTAVEKARQKVDGLRASIAAAEKG
jgi:hypothetical protein